MTLGPIPIGTSSFQHIADHTFFVICVLVFLTACSDRPDTESGLETLLKFEVIF